MKPFRLFFLLLLLCGAVSCGTPGLSTKLQNTPIGTTKQEVVKQLGRNYTVIHSMLTPEGQVMEILKYHGGINSYDYELEFMNDVLVRYTRILPPPEKKEHKHDKHN